MDKIIRLSKSSIGDEEIRAVVKVLKEEYLGMGSYVNNFEDELSNYFQSPAVCVVNGTAALQLALQACGIGADDEVLVQSLTYVASFQAISATGAVPVACDVSKESITIDLVDAESKITEKTKAIMPVHYSGGVGDLKSIYDFAKKYNLRVIEDAAQAHGSEYNNKKIGNFGDFSCFSFYPTKNLGAYGEGGAVVTNSKTNYNKLVALRNHGSLKQYEHEFIGHNYRMSGFQGSILSVKLKYLDKWNEVRINNARLYNKYLDLIIIKS